jgi:DsbC/DsbD-like thiol-disulfide interchange protein
MNSPDMNSIAKFVGVWLAALCCLLAGDAKAAAPENLVQAELLADVAAVQPGKPFTLGVRLHIADGWHVYWTNPGDAGAPTTFKLQLPPGFTAGPVQYPVPEKLTVPPGLTVYAYPKEVMLMVTVTPPAALDQSTITIPAKAGWCVCSDQMCVLGKREFGISLPVAAGPQPDNQGLFASWRSRLPISADQAFSAIGPFFNISSNSHEIVGDIALTWRNAPPTSDIQWLPGPRDDLITKPTEVKTDGQASRFHLTLDQVEGIPQTTSKISGILAYYVPGQPPRGVALDLDASR